MLTKLRLKNFKNFQDAELHLGGFTLLVGTNAAGKSNIRDAMRFLHGIGRGYTLAEIIGGKFSEGGAPEWQGIRGGANEISFRKAKTFELGIDFTTGEEDQQFKGHYEISVRIDPFGSRVLAESLIFEEYSQPIFKTGPFPTGTNNPEGQGLIAKFYDQRDIQFGISHPIDSDRPLLAQFNSPKFFKEWGIMSSLPQQLILMTTTLLADIRFPDLNSDEMRQPAIPGQKILTDRGSNLSSVVQSISANPQRKAALLSWLGVLTPMDAKDFCFTPDVIGKVILQFVESDGHLTSAFSASDGTLKFLGFLAAFLSPEPAKLLFLEELENGIHPTRLHLVLQLIEQQVKQQNIQTIATTHSPNLLLHLDRQTLENVSLVYRLPGKPDGEIRRIMDIPNIQKILETQDLGRLEESGWFEDVMYFTADDEAAAA
ncbi:MAG: AAA family ATPase [Alkalinema sp. RU_4_3]|nr:AAA family ATPase [Alkalinema sp. RU_4_3]